jgi:MFS family permease
VERDFWLFWSGQTVSAFGTAFTLFALPLLVFELTESAINLALAEVAAFLPYPLFSLVVGALADRLDRRRVMIAADAGRAALIATVPLLAEVGALRVWWIYVVSFIVTTLAIAFSAGRFAVVPSLVRKERLVTANGRLEAGANGAHILGPLLAGALLGLGLPTADVLYADAASFIVSAVSVALIKTPIAGATVSGGQRSIRADVAEGLRFLLGHPLLRSLVLLSALLNFVGATQWAQLVLFAKERLLASGPQVSILWSAGAAGAIAFAIGAAWIRDRVRFSRVVLGSVVVGGTVTVAFALVPWYWPEVILWASIIGLGQLRSVVGTAVRQTITPPSMLGRVGAAGQAISLSAIPAGILLGGWLIETTGSVRGVYAGIGVLIVLLGVVFSFGAIGRYPPP